MRRLVVAQVVLVLSLVVMVPVMVLGISTSVGPDVGEPVPAGSSGEFLKIPEAALRAYVNATAEAKELVLDWALGLSLLRRSSTWLAGTEGPAEPGRCRGQPLERTEGSVFGGGRGTSTVDGSAESEHAAGPRPVVVVVAPDREHEAVVVDGCGGDTDRVPRR